MGLERTILATGGGAVLRETNRENLKRLGTVVWLRVTPEEAVRRMKPTDRRPALTGLPPLEEARLLADRLHTMYEQVADHVVQTDGRSPQEVCDELEQLWHAASGDDLR
jgi:shikimate kinase